MAPFLRMTYFPVRGRGEFIRLIAAIGKLELSERRVTFAEWFASTDEKAKAPNGSLPYLQVDGGRLVIGQHMAAGRFVASLAGLAAKDAETRAVTEDWAEAANDLYSTFGPVAVASFIRPEPEKVPALMATFVEGKWTAFCKRLNEHLKGKKWLAGEELTWADCYVAEWVDRMHRMNPKGKIAGCEEVDKYRERFYAIPEIANYVKNRGWVGAEGEKLYK